MSSWQLLRAMIRNRKSNKLNREMIGFSIEQELDPIREEDVRAYAKATRDEAPPDSVPPFFVAKLIFPFIKEILTHKDLHLNLLRMVHGQQKVSWFKPVHVGDQLKLRLVIEDVQDTPAGELLIMRGSAFLGDELAIEAEAGTLIRAKKKGSKQKRAEPDPPKEAFRIEIQTEEGQQLEYAKASTDNNFIHTNNFLAKMAGLPRTIMHGVCVMAMTCNALADQVSAGDRGQLVSISGRFAFPALPGDRFTVIGHENNSGDTTPFIVVNEKGKPIIKNGEISFRG